MTLSLAIFSRFLWFHPKLNLPPWSKDFRFLPDYYLQLSSFSCPFAHIRSILQNLFYSWCTYWYNHQVFWYILCFTLFGSKTISIHQLTIHFHPKTHFSKNLIEKTVVCKWRIVSLRLICRCHWFSGTIHLTCTKISSNWFGNVTVFLYWTD